MFKNPSLLTKIIIAVIAGALCSQFFPEWLGRVFATINGLFSGFLNFFVPVLIFALIAPAIAKLGKGAGRLLGLTVGLSYGSTIIAGLLAYALSVWLYPMLLDGATMAGSIADIEEGALSPYFSVEMAPPFEVMTALLLSFCIGMAMTVVKTDVLYRGAVELEQVVIKIIWSFVVPLLPIYIFGMFVTLGMNGNIGSVLSSFTKVLTLAVVSTLVYLFVQYLVAGAVAGVNPFKALRTMSPAYFTALGTSSSAASIPISREAALKNGVSEEVAGFVIPLCATIHLSGSMIKLMLYAFALTFMTGMDVPTSKALGFMFLLAITMIAAPGVPGGAVMVATGLLSEMMGFDDSMVALMIAAYIAIDSVGTAANVTGDGAIALIVDKFAPSLRKQTAPAHPAE
ncbi:dicarboxylate/amino acid:cation symporter [Corynebacterium incognita]|uniref:dicarboxylate/amino acid:cation symporter n=1 Tax=Corynebacterium incognita TaxID=2754725 RepID=UPI001FE29E5C|nr:dicarboxylate/amino acid:cation symporter [Corynebacterium incognita]